MKDCPNAITLKIARWTVEGGLATNRVGQNILGKDIKTGQKPGQKRYWQEKLLENDEKQVREIFQMVRAIKKNIAIQRQDKGCCSQKRNLKLKLANVNIKKPSVIAHDLSILNFDACKGVYLYWNTFKSITRSAIQQKIQNGSNRKWL